MVVMILEKVSPSVRGELTRWLLEARTGVFAGEVSAGVREKLWERVCQNAGTGGAVLLHNANTEQGFKIRLHGATSRSVADFDGLSLIRIP